MMMNTFSLKVVIAALLLTACNQAFAKNPQLPKERLPQRPSFESVDTNRDSDISFEEFSKEPLPYGDHQTVFDIIDTNNNGVIDEAEYKNHHPKKPPHNCKENKMINAVNSGTQAPMNRVEASLTQDQQTLISDTLKQFDPENLSDADAQSIVESFSKAGIEPGRALEQTMTDLGFDARSIGEAANVKPEGNRPPPPPKQSSETISSLVDYLTELLDKNGTDLSEDDKKSIYEKVSKEFGIPAGDSVINTSA